MAAALLPAAAAQDVRGESAAAAEPLWLLFVANNFFEREEFFSIQIPLGCLGYSHTKIEGKAKKNGWTKEPGGGDDFHISR